MARYRYEIEVSHAGLNKYRHISGTDRRIVEQKAASQYAQWDEQYARKLEQQARSDERERARQQKEIDKLQWQTEAEKKRKRIADAEQEAEEKTLAAQAALDAAEGILKSTLVVNDAINWSDLFDNNDFERPQPQVPSLPDFPVKPTLVESIRPEEADVRFRPERTLLSGVFPWVKRRAEQQARDRFQSALRQHEEQVQRNLRATDAWRGNYERIEKVRIATANDFEKRARKWLADREEHQRTKAARNAEIEELRKQFDAGEESAVQEYFSMVLERSRYPDFIPHDFDVQFDKLGSRTIVEFRLPAQSDLPSLSDVKFVKSREEFVSKEIAKTAYNKIYDGVIAQLALRTIHEVFESDVHRFCELVVFNGYLDYVDRASGKDATAVLLTVAADREAFLQIDLARVDPIACLKSLKAVFAPKIHTITPVKPLATINREDKRFVDAKSVVGGIDEGVNIAAMPWEDFEHLVREVFEREFSTGGGEVKVTQASRDGGVDAIAFDPDPIRGGKIVIQAKRYTNTVGVSAVRDLYGTVMNEGATKGILVTTAQYGPDAFEFAKDKPITLLDGANLLYLLGKHGTKARIDLVEAKSMRLQQEG